MASSDTNRRGDPAFAGDDRITHEPVVEQHRPSGLPEPDTLRRPFPWVIVGAVLAALLIGIVAGATAGWQYAIPLVVLAVLLGAFALFNWGLGKRHGGDYPEGSAEDVAATDADNPVPHVGFDEDTQLGASSEQSDAERAAHADVERSTGRR